MCVRQDKVVIAGDEQSHDQTQTYEKVFPADKEAVLHDVPCSSSVPWRVTELGTHNFHFGKLRRDQKKDALCCVVFCTLSLKHVCENVSQGWVVM